MLTRTTDKLPEISWGFDLNAFLINVNRKKSVIRRARKLQGKNNRRVVGGLGFRQTAPPNLLLIIELHKILRKFLKARYDVTKVFVLLGRFADPFIKLAIKGKIKCTLKYMTYEQNLELANQN